MALPRPSVLVLLPVLLASPSHAVPAPQTGPVIDPARELMITNLAVVEDPVRTAPGGCWHFGTLMKRMAGTVPPEQFVDHWLNTFIQPQVVNGVPIDEPQKALAFSEFRAAWLNGGSTLDLNAAPFRLLAIVNRPDLVRVTPEGITAFGEMRFVYGAYWPGNPNDPRAFHVIFEYGVPSSSCGELQQWATNWHTLGSYTPGTRDYNLRLQVLTDSIPKPQVGSSRPNCSLLNQLRSNEFELDQDLSLFWNLREWNIVAPIAFQGQLESVTTKQTPHFSFVKTTGGRAILREFLDQNRADILAGTHVVPDFFTSPTAGTVSFQTGDAVNNSFHGHPHGGGPFCCNGTLWWSPGYQGAPEQPTLTVEDANVRHGFALQTCSGCHQMETGSPFTMVSNRFAGTSSALSPFLTGTTVPDPVAPMALDANNNMVPVNHSFADLDHRKSVLKRMLQLSCTPPPGQLAPIDVLLSIKAEIGTRVH